MPATPWSQPGMTWPWPSGKLKASPRSHELSKTVPSFQRAPTYCTETFWPALVVAPVPFLMSLITSLVGGSPPGVLIVGLEPSLPVTLTAAPELEPLEASSVAVSVGASVGAWVAASVGAAVAEPSSEDESSPHAAKANTAISKGRASRYRRMGASG